MPSMTRKQMIDFLSDHFRYHTMNSLNNATSYARCVKLNRLSFPSAEVRDRAYDLLNAEDSFVLSGVNGRIRQFDESYDHQYQIGFNGRSGGYMVLYQGGRKPSEYKTICRSCGQRNYQAHTTVCGLCHSENMVPYTGFDVFIRPGRGMDVDMDFDCWETASLRDRVRLVKAFDRCCDDCVKLFIQFAAENEAVEKTVQVPKQIVVVRPINKE
jgi:hypothetical protein